MSPPQTCSTDGGSPAQHAHSKAAPSVTIWWPQLCLSPNHHPPRMETSLPPWCITLRERGFPRVQPLPSGAAVCGCCPLLHHLLPQSRMWLHPVCNHRLMLDPPSLSFPRLTGCSSSTPPCSFPWQTGLPSPPAAQHTVRVICHASAWLTCIQPGLLTFSSFLAGSTA